MKKCTITLVDEVNVHVDDIEPHVRREITNALSYELPYARYLPGAKLGRSTAKKAFFNLNGTTYFHCLAEVVEILDKHKYDIEIQDYRTEHDFQFEPVDENFFSDVQFGHGHHMEGKSIVLREHQVNAVNTLLENRHGLLLASTSSGKAQPLYEPVLTPDGWVPMGNITAGSEVVTPDGSVAKVLQVYPQGGKEVFEITFEDGRTAQCCKEHLWEVYSSHNGNAKVHSTSMIMKLMNMVPMYIDVCTDLGTSASFTPSHSKYGEQMTDENVNLNMKYLSGSRQQKVNMLSNILTNMGNTFSTGSVMFDDFKTIAYSAGIILDIKEVRPGFSYVTITDKTKLRIVSIKSLKWDECQCIMIDSAEHLYITRDYIITHNTMICATLVKSVEKYGRTLTIVPSTDLVQQTYNDYEMVGLDCGMYYADRKDFHATHVVTTWQSLNVLKKDTKKGIIPITEEDLYSLFDGVVAFIVDEAHTSSAEALFDTLSSAGGPGASVPIRWAMTGTLPKEKIFATKIKCNVGDVVYKITAKELMDKGVLSTCKINCVQLKETKTFKDYQSELKYLVSDDARMEYVASLIADIASTGNTLVLVDRIEAGELLCKHLGIPVKEFVKGDTKKGDRESSYGEIRWADNKILIATYGVASTGISISRLYNVVLLEPGKSFVRTIQSIGRGLRKAEDKDHVEIYDIFSSSKYSSKHSKERIKYYKEAEYPYEVLKINDWL